MTTHKKVKSDVTFALMYSLSLELSKSAGHESHLSIMQKMAAYNTVQTITKIIRNECLKRIGYNGYADDIEHMKAAIWDETAEVYFWMGVKARKRTWSDKGEVIHYNIRKRGDIYQAIELIANIPTMIETIFYDNYDLMKPIKNLESNICRMSRLCIEPTVKPKLSRTVVDKFNDVTSKHVYRYIKNVDEKRSA